MKNGDTCNNLADLSHFCDDSMEKKLKKIKKSFHLIGVSFRYAHNQKQVGKHLVFISWLVFLPTNRTTQACEKHVNFYAECVKEKEASQTTKSSGINYKKWSEQFVVEKDWGEKKKVSNIAAQVDIVGMFVTETGSHKVVPASITRAKMVEYKVMNETGERGGGGGGGGGGTHLAATVKNTVRRLLRRTKSHRDTPSSNTSMIMQTTNGNHVNNLATVRNKTNNVNDPTARRSQPPLPTSFEQHSSRNSYGRRHSRLRVRLQVRERRLTEKSFPPRPWVSREHQLREQYFKSFL